MIRTGYSVAVTEEDLDTGNDDFFGDDFGTTATASTSSIVGKRKLSEAQDSAIMQLKTLGLDSDDDDDDDILVLDTEGDPLLLADEIDLTKSVGDRPSESGNKSTVLKSRNAPLPATSTTATTSSGDEDGKDSSKWLRSVMDTNGKLRCIVTNTETASNSGDTESLIADTIQGLVKNYLTKRSLVVDDGGILSTPLHIVKQLASEHGEMIHCEGTAFPNGYNRMELFSGNLRGVGEGMTMKIARQMAAIDLLEQAQLSVPGIRVPAMALLPGWLTNPAVFRDLFALCKEKNLPRIKIESKLNYDETVGVDPNRSKWRAVCTVGDLQAVGESEEDIFARREAAKEMYQVITNMEYKDLPIAIGRSCLRLAELGDSGFQPIMSNQKKIWLLKNRVENNKLIIRDEEDDLAQYDIEELKKDLTEADLLTLDQERVNPKKLKVTVKNTGPKLCEDDLSSEVSSTTMSRCVSVELINNSEAAPWF